jgi:hypothetical protein
MTTHAARPMKDELRRLISAVGQLVPGYWPDPPATDDYVLDFERGLASAPALPEGETVLSLIASGDERSLLGGPEVSDETYAEHAADILASVTEALEATLPLYAPHRPTDGLKDPHTVTHNLHRGDSSLASLEVRGINGTLQIVDTSAKEHTQVFIHPAPPERASSGLAVTTTDNFDTATASERQAALNAIDELAQKAAAASSDVIRGRDPGDESD